MSSATEPQTWEAFTEEFEAILRECESAREEGERLIQECERIQEELKLKTPKWLQIFWCDLATMKVTDDSDENQDMCGDTSIDTISGMCSEHEWSDDEDDDE